MGRGGNGGRHFPLFLAKKGVEQQSGRGKCQGSSSLTFLYKLTKKSKAAEKSGEEECRYGKRCRNMAPMQTFYSPEKKSPMATSRFFLFYILLGHLPHPLRPVQAAVGPLRQEVGRPVLRAEPQGQQTRKLRLQPPQQLLRGLPPARRPLRHATLLPPQREAGVRHGVGGHTLALLHQPPGEDHTVPVGASGPGKGFTKNIIPLRFSIVVSLLASSASILDYFFF